VVAVDGARQNGGWQAFASAGRRATSRDAVGWCTEAAERGAGELLLTSIDADGTGGGYDLDLVRAVCERVDVPVIASGGAGGPADMAAALEAGAQAALAASIFHDGRHSFAEVKEEVARWGLPVRI
jgi:cyclase